MAEALDFLYFDTGAMYRAVTWAAIEQCGELQDGDAVGKLAERIRLVGLPEQEVAE